MREVTILMVGGPFDGFSKTYRLDPATLQPVVEIPYNVAVVAATTGEKLGDLNAPKARLAIYERFGYTYRFVVDCLAPVPLKKK